MRKEEKMNKYEGRTGMCHKEFSVKEYRYDGESRTISGYAAIFGNIDKSRDKLIKGCFSNSISERGPESGANDRILLLWQHDMSEPIGRITKLQEDDKGLYFEAVIDDIEIGDRALKQLESGTLNQFSIGYNYVWEHCEWDDEEACLVVKEVKLYEISVVSIGCNGETEYLGLKSQEDAEKAYEELNREISSFSSKWGMQKQHKLQNIIAKAMSLASWRRPDAGKAVPPAGEGADSGGHANKKTLFNKIKMKKL